MSNVNHGNGNETDKNTLLCKGRNGFFKARHLTVRRNEDGTVTFELYSKIDSGTAPLQISGSPEMIRDLFNIAAGDVYAVGICPDTTRTYISRTIGLEDMPFVRRA